VTKVKHKQTEHHRTTKRNETSDRRPTLLTISDPANRRYTLRPTNRRYSPVHARRDSVNECRSSTQTRRAAILRNKNKLKVNFIRVDMR